MNNNKKKSFKSALESLKKDYETEVERAGDAKEAFLDSAKSRFLQDFEYLEDLGEGAYGMVSKCTHRFNGHDYAAKDIQFVSLSCLQHESIVRYYNSWMEIDIVEAIYLKIIRYVSYIHEKGVIHEDLASMNIFLSQSSRIKVADFAKIGNVDLHQARPGHKMYFAAERSQQGGVIDAKVDIYTIDVILWELLSHFASARERAEEISKFVNSRTFKDEVGEAERILILRLTSNDPVELPSAAELCSM
ncbi:hypothetical protein MKW94_022575 [Papaver nudicaule]|uniref:Protein kinase domain-containing protein n=1 Tax=Papaver nudicaule TaxID=74823 RepID=A0AA41UZN0_PAPNU|nr:hypothetical protein [Papaver nudicaule]